jgi:DnaJ family protein A protein 2
MQKDTEGEDEDDEDEPDLDQVDDDGVPVKKEKPKKAKKEAKSPAKKGAAAGTNGEESPKPKFSRLRNGVDLVMEKKITLHEALLGFQFSIKHLDGRILIIRSPPNHVVSADDIMIIDGEGMPVYRNPTSHGDLYVKLSIQMPTPDELKDPKVRADIARLLPGGGPLGSDVTEHAEQHIAKPYNEEQAKQKARENQERQRSSAYSREDDDDERGGGGGTQCRQM